MTTSTKLDTSGINSSFLGSHAISEGDVTRLPSNSSSKKKAKFTAKRGMHIRRTAIELAAGEPWEGIRLATPLRTTLDLLCNVKLRRSLPRTVGLLDVLLRNEFIKRDALDALLRTRHDRGIVRARRCLKLADPRAESIPESEVRVWLVLGGLEPDVQINVHDAAGDFLGRLDLGFSQVKVAVEYDGKWHGEPEQQRYDLARRRRLEDNGWTFIVVTQEWLREDPRGMVNTVRDALLRRT
jgi:very-short-patch-repair endonuclease